MPSKKQENNCCQEANMLRNGDHSSDTGDHAHLHGQFGKPFEPRQAGRHGLRSDPEDFESPAPNGSDFTVFLVDDDASVLGSLSSLLRSVGYRIVTFSSAVEFLALEDESVPGCAILDVFMPDLDGLQLQATLAARGGQRPVIFITGRGDVPTSVRAMKAGAVDFLTKPVHGDDLLAAVARAERKEAEARRMRNELASIDVKLATLTQREQEVLTGVIGGRANKQIAFDLGIGEKTIKVHRGRMMQKMGVRTVAELVRLTERAGISPQH
jgi:FixJ family two-component response regulator